MALACTPNLVEMLTVILTLFYVSLASMLSGCSNDALIKANQQQLEHQQAELDKLTQEVAALQTQPRAPDYAAAAPGSCDRNILSAATRKGGERFAASDFGAALSYYQDALTACPGSAQANVNLARTYEALGDRQQALAHYKIAAAATGADADAAAVRDARLALSRLGS